MAEAKTKPTTASVADFIAKVEDPQKRADSAVLIELMERITGYKATMWGPSIVGFGTYHYQYDSGHEGDSSLAAFSPRKSDFSIYLNGGFLEATRARRATLLEKLGKHRMGGGCMYVKRLEQIDLKVLEKLVKISVDSLQARYPG